MRHPLQPVAMPNLYSNDPGVLVMHYHDHIKNFGSPNGLCSSITESKHIAAVKRPWRHSNHYRALAQILKVNEQLDKLTAARANFTTCGMLTDSPLTAAILDATSNDDRSDCDDNRHEHDEGNNTNIMDTDNDDRGGNDDNGGGGGDDNGGGGGDDNDDNGGGSDDDDNDNDHGPVESRGPLMNEVRLAHDKGTYHSLYLFVFPVSHKPSSPHPRLPTNFHGPWNEDRPTRPT